MEQLTPAQRKLAFAVIVFVLVGLAVYLFTSRGSGSSGQAAPDASPAATRTTAPATVPPSPPPPSSSAPSSSAPATTATTAPNIYQWVPFSRAELGDAATTAVRFGDAYGTYSYTESTKAYLATMRKVVTSAVAGQISAAYAAPGVKELRSSRKQVATGSASISSLRAFGSTSLTFVVVVGQKITAKGGRSHSTTSYAITLTGSGRDWQVSSVELASAGNS